VQLTLPGWREEESGADAREWRHETGGVLSLQMLGELAVPSPKDVNSLRQKARQIAERVGAGLVQADAVATPFGSSGSLIYKRRVGTGFTFTGMLWIPIEGNYLLFTAVDGERGTTGVREAITTAKLLKAGELTQDTYQASWARDPYDPSYVGVDRQTLRYLSDSEVYDENFPDHPLSRVRRLLQDIPAHVVVDPAQSPRNQVE
jgi:hypothetical protein